MKMNGGNVHARLVHSVAARQQSVGLDPALPLVSSSIDLSWQRCLKEFNLDPDRDYAPKVLDESTIRARQAQFDELVQIARAEMDSLYEQISGSGFALLLADTQGVILCEKVQVQRVRSSIGCLGHEKEQKQKPECHEDGNLAERQ